MKVNPGIGGRGASISMERKAHPNSHFHIGEMRIKRANDGSFVIHHHMELKKKHEGKEEYMGGYREPEVHTAQDSDELMAHVTKHFGKKKKGAEGSAAEEASESASEASEEGD